MMGFLDKMVEHLAAAWLERVLGGKASTVAAVLGGAALSVANFTDVLPKDWVAPVSNVAAIVLAIAALMGYGPKGAYKSATKTLLFGVVLFCACGAWAQTPPNTPPAPEPLANIYAAGVSYSVNATPGVAGTGLYAHLLSDTGTYAFTAIDALPNTLRPLTVTSNIGVGVAQRVFTVGGVPVFMPTAAGVSWSGSNTGWQWSGGALLAVHVRGTYYLMPSIRFLKSSVSNGSGYQPILGVLFAWGN